MKSSDLFIGKSEKRQVFANVIFNFLKTLSSLFFPVVSFAYSSRVLGVDGIGKVNYSKSIVVYFSMIALLGVNYYGTREAAKCRNDRNRLSALFRELFIINSISTVTAYVLFFFTIYTVKGLDGYRDLLIINSASILFTGLGIEWLYQGLEKFRYIAVRSVIFQITALILMVVFVKEPGDIRIYTALMVVATSGFNLLNIANCHKYVNLLGIHNVNVIRHMKPILWLFAFAASIELYTVLDSTMLGYIMGDSAVGLYTAAVKINKLAIALINSIGVVLIPRLSYYIGSGNKEKTNSIIHKGYNYGFMLSVPAFLGLLCLSKEIVLLFSGKAFSNAVITMRIISPIVLIIPFSVMTNQQTLIPMGREKRILLASSCAAIMNFTLNMNLIPRFAENGAAIATVAAELTAAIVSYVNARLVIGIKGVFSHYYQYIIASIPIVFIRIAMGYLFINSWKIIAGTVFMSAVLYSVILFLLKNKYYMEVINLLRESIVQKYEYDRK